MSEPKFTEGEWQVANGLLVGEQQLFIHCFGVKVICRLTKKVDTTPLTEEDVANAHLIAAAPKLYEFIETHMIGFPEADKLLAKARGEV